MEWENTGNAPSPKAPEYHIEHVLEWQLVTRFFDWVQKEYYQNQASLDSLRPGAKTGARVKFCELWIDFWEWPVDIDGVTLPAKDHITRAYPSKKFHAEEFVWLQADMNTPSKANVSHPSTLPFTFDLSRVDVER